MSNNIDINDISKTTNEFSFVEQIFNTINNKDFIQNAYANMFGEENPKETEQSYIYYALSSIGQQIMDEIYSHTLNYIDDVSNIDLCKVKALQSYAKLLGVDYVIFNSLNKIPLDILKIIDIMSLNPTYLVDSKYVNAQLASMLSTDMLSIKVIDDESNITKLTTHNFDNILSGIYKNLIETKLNQKYNAESLNCIYQELSQSIILSSFQLPIAFNDQNNINELKRKYNIKSSFNEKEHADNIDLGISSIDDFQKTEQEVIKYEIDRRKKSKYGDKLSTRYVYYKEREVKEYYDFVSNSYQNELTSNNMQYNNEYAVDPNYILLSNSIASDNISYNGFLSVGDNQDCILRQDYIDSSVKQLVYLTKQIREIRESLKSQSQKNFMKGAFVLIEHIIKEYICQLAQQYEELSTLPYTAINVDIQEYYDTTEYYNISSNISANDLNLPYWETAKTIKYILPYNSNNIFEQPKITYGSGSGISEVDINDLYKNILNMRFKTSADVLLNSNMLSSFLTTIYKSAAEKMYLSNDVIIYFDEENNEKYIPLNEELSSVFEQYKKELFLRYTENKVGYTPYAYIKNTVHPTYELHPYIKQFVEKTLNDFPIKDIANLVDDSLKFSIHENIDKYLDDAGFLINAWNNPLNTNDDYQSKYENSSNINELNMVDRVVDYNGLFYPTAINEFIKNKDKFLSSLSNIICTNEYYKGLNLSHIERKNIAQKLEDNYIDINSIYSENYAITKYIEDQFSTEYFILKNNIDQKIYVKFRNHSIAMSISSQIEVDNEHEIEIQDVKDIDISYNGQYIIFKYDEKYDIFEADKVYDSTTLLTTYRLNHYKTVNKENYTAIQFVNLDTSLVFIFAKVNNKNIDIVLQSITPTQSKDNVNTSNISFNLLQDNIELSDIHFDVTMTGKLTIAYIKDTDINKYKRSNCLENIYVGNTNIVNYDCLENLIVTHDFYITPMTILSADEQYFNEHTDMGFIPVCISSTNNVITSNYIIDNYAVYKCEIFGLSTNNCIDFKFTAPLRSYISSINGYEDLEFLAFDDNTKNNSITTNSNIKTKYDLKNILNGRYLPLKSDEGYVEDILIEYPELVATSCYITHENISEKNNSLIINLSNTAILKFVDNDKIKNSSLYCNTNKANYDEISVQWSINKGKIQLDFNSYYAKELSTINSIDNTRNNKHLFLNLTEPGAAGYLNIYSNLNNDSEHEQVQRYYIKNISDNKPKFILSAEISQNENSFKTYEKNKNYNMLSDKNGNVIVFDQPNNVIEYMKVEN